MPEDPRLKAIRIKTGVVKRVAKEKQSYQKEAAGLEQKLEAFKNSDQGADDAAVARLNLSSCKICFLPDALLTSTTSQQLQFCFSSQPAI